MCIIIIIINLNAFQYFLQVERACSIVVACVVLHNLCVRTGDDQPPDDLTLIAGRRIYDDIPAIGYNGAHRPGAAAARTALINNFFSH